MASDKGIPAMGVKSTPQVSPGTVAELKLLGAISMVVGQSEWLKPAQRAMVKRMRRKGLLSKRNPNWATMTQKGKRVR
jgi:hypothetical protein